MAGADTYAALRLKIEVLQPAPRVDEREVHWIDDLHHLGVSRDEQTRIEIFLTGPRLTSSSSLLEANLVYDTWQRIGEDQLVANRLLLPAEPHFDALAAFLCTHLVDNGVLTDVQLGFQRSEPVIEIVYQRSSIRAESLVGLAGELLVLRAMIDQRPSRVRDVLLSWHGYGRSARDFQLGAVGLEVKTTRGSTSRHRVQGTRQVEVGHGVGEIAEDHFYLVSIGIEDVQPGQAVDNSWTLPNLVDGILNLLADADLPPEEIDALGSAFVHDVRAYGAEDGEGYDHEEIGHRLLFGQHRRTAFVRMYDMDDQAISVIRSNDLVPFAMIDPESVEFTIELPTQVHGDLNPVVGLTRAVADLLDRGWGPVAS